MYILKRNNQESSQKLHKLSFLLSNLSLKNRIIIQHISATRDKVLWYFMFYGCGCGKYLAHYFECGKHW